MHFCSNCGNMYYIKLMESEKKQLIYYCRKCGNEDNSLDETSIIVSKTNLKKNKQQYSHIINKYTKLDPTLPRIHNLDCPNDSCLSNNSDDDKVEKEIIYIRYDNENMKYIYLCGICDKVWQLEKSN
jgi:DNA-directed RNA polymerase subunit M/transcription elongation factor TFIIS